MRIVAAVASTMIVLIYAAGSGVWVSSGDSWYRSLSQPPWQPPDIVFGLIWPYNFLALIVAGLVVSLAGTSGQRWVWLAGLAVSVAAALGWAYSFYIGQELWLAAVLLALAFLFTVPIVIVAWRTNWWAGLILLPYAAWVAVATSLAIGYAMRN